jgi:histone-lysine N-methyltransferase SETD2
LLQDKARAAAMAAAASGGGAAGAPASRPHKRPPVWQLITGNVYTHRERKVQDEDDIMICQCKKIWATDTTTVGCGPECLNRMLNIECVEVRWALGSCGLLPAVLGAAVHVGCGWPPGCLSAGRCS